MTSDPQRVTRGGTKFHGDSTSRYADVLLGWGAGYGNCCSACKGGHSKPDPGTRSLATKPPRALRFAWVAHMTKLGGAK